MASQDNDEIKDFDQLSDFVLKTLQTGQIGITEALGMKGPLKRQAGKLPQAMGHLMRRYCREDAKTAAIIELATEQSPAFRSLAERWGLAVKDAERA